MQIILLTYPGERPMRPEFGSRLRDFVFRSADNSTAAELALEVRNSLLRSGSRGSTSTTCSCDPTRSNANRLNVEIVYAVKQHERPPQPGVPLLHDPRRRK